MLNNIRAGIRFFLFIMLTVIVVPLHALWYGVTRRMDLPKIWHRLSCQIFGITVRIHGEPAQTDQPLLYVANHISYLDIIVLGGFLDVRFVAKREVANWPVFGFLSKLQRTVFIDRHKNALPQARIAMQTALKSGDKVLFFPEGTSSDGSCVLPFKPPLFAMFFEDGNEPAVTAMIQPITIVPVLLDSEPMANNQTLLDVYAWYGDMVLAPHLWAFAKHRRTEIAVYLLPAHNPQDFATRHDLANTLQADIASCLQACQAPVT